MNGHQCIQTSPFAAKRVPPDKCPERDFFFLSPMDFDFFFSFCNFLCELEMKTIHLVPQRAAGVNGITV